jgi:hypothetical protein
MRCLNLNGWRFVGIFGSLVQSLKNEVGKNLADADAAEFTPC